jgi:hypothetical protein
MEPTLQPDFDSFTIDDTKFILKPISFEAGRRILALVLRAGKGGARALMGELLSDYDLPFLDNLITKQVFYEKDGETSRVTKQFLENNKQIYLELISEVSEKYASPFLPRGSGELQDSPPTN